MDPQSRLDAMDAKIIALFERRMAIVQKQAGSISRGDLKKQRRRRGADAADKVTKHACEVDIIAYTEELITLILAAAQQYQKALMRLNSRQKKRRLFL